MEPPNRDADPEASYYADRPRRTALILLAVVAALAIAGGLHLTGILPPG